MQQSLVNEWRDDVQTQNNLGIGYKSHCIMLIQYLLTFTSYISGGRGNQIKESVRSCINTQQS